MEICLLYCLDEIFLHMFLVPPLDRYSKSIDILYGYAILRIIEKSNREDEKSYNHDTKYDHSKSLIETEDDS